MNRPTIAEVRRVAAMAKAAYIAAGSSEDPEWRDAAGYWNGVRDALDWAADGKFLDLRAMAEFAGQAEAGGGGR